MPHCFQQGRDQRAAATIARLATATVAIMAVSANFANAANNSEECEGTGSLQPCMMVRRQGLHFELEDGSKFRPVGTSLYWAMPWMYYSNSTATVALQALDDIQDFGANVVRIWAFGEGSGAAALQPEPMQYNENALKALDRALHEIGKRGMRALVVLANYWSAYGGTQQYVKWAKDAGEDVSSKDDFFTNEKIGHWYRQFVRMLLTRRNTFSGYEYRHDPTIFALELINEPRYKDDPTGDVLQKWFEYHSWFVRQYDDQHLLTTGIEGFFGNSTPNIAKYTNPFGSSVTEGTDFVRNHRDLPNIDFCVHHMWVDNWLDASCGDTCKRSFMLMWYEEHTRAATELIGKPVMAEEYGKRGKDVRPWYFQRIMEHIEQGISLGNAAQGGGLIWQYGVPEYQGDDPYTIYPTDYTEVTMLTAHSRSVRNN